MPRNAEYRCAIDVARTHKFDTAAKDYDRWYQSPVNAFIDTLEKQAIETILPQTDGERLILEAGCGTGHWLPFLGRGGNRVVGLDISEQMLSVASTKFAHSLPLVRANAMCMPFRSSCFDAAYAITTLEFTRDPARVLDEMYRCLKPGGTLGVGVLNAFSFLGLKRRLFPSATFRGARFFTVRELRGCLERYGRVSLNTCVFLPPYRALLPFAGLLERLGKTLFAVLGQFIVASVRKPGSI